MLYMLVCQTVNALHTQPHKKTLSIPHIPVLFETDRILIVNKPHGVSHHNDDNVDGSHGILHLLRQQRSEKNERLWGVHRLDKVTSGILVFAKDQEMASALSRKFAQGKIRKIYFGISAKKPKKKKQGWVIGGMKRSRSETWMLTRTSTSTTPGSNGTPSNLAKTRFFTSSITANGGISVPPNQNMLYGPRTVIMFLPYTGKTHQLRVAAKSIGIALMGDPLYETGLPDKQNLPTENAVHLPYRTMLHASGISIPSCTENDTPISIWCEPPFYDDVDTENPWLGITDSIALVVEQLMAKHCHTPSILEAMLLSRGNSTKRTHST
jgi:tRNA pseudouridine32 synthase / 23S rRNA pseudouridine746 synthase